jgi:hypothetical protein
MKRGVLDDLTTPGAAATDDGYLALMVVTLIAGLAYLVGVIVSRVRAVQRQRN